MPIEVRIEIVVTKEGYRTTAVVDGAEVFHRTWKRTPTGSTAGKHSQDPWDLATEDDDTLPSAIESAESIGADLMQLCED